MMPYRHFNKMVEVIDFTANFADNPARFGHARRIFSVARVLFCEEY